MVEPGTRPSLTLSVVVGALGISIGIILTILLVALLLAGQSLLRGHPVEAATRLDKMSDTGRGVNAKRFPSGDRAVICPCISQSDFWSMFLRALPAERLRETARRQLGCSCRPRPIS